MIEARGITKFFPVVNPRGIAEGNTALVSVSLKVDAGEFLAIVGTSGSGKSTFLEILAGLQAPTEGEVYVEGKRVLEPLPGTRREMEAYRRKYRFLSPIVNSTFRDMPKSDTAIVFQDGGLFPWMTALENVVFVLKLRGMARRERVAWARKYLSLVGLKEGENKYPAQLSGGMRQRVALARALSVEPKIILMDEPFAAVDAASRQHLQEDLTRLWQAMGQTIVFVTHDVEEAILLANRVVVFSPAPGTVRNTIDVGLPRPRHLFRRQIDDLKHRIMEIYRFDATGEVLDYAI
ncbi:MAG: ABC transporter ATP-binding protein [Bacillota bacterium]|jgi:NitT/TauT family transport system ATP-binding protein